MASAEPPPAIDRATLVRTITGLTPSDLARVVAFIDGAALHIGRHGTVPEQAAELIRWAESSTGPSLQAIQRALQQLSPDPQEGAQQAAAGRHPLVPKNPYVEFESFGQLLKNLESSERCYQANMREAEQTEARHGPFVSLHSRLQAAALLFQPDPAKMPGIDRIEALVNEEWGTNLTSESVRRLRGKLCRILGCGTESVDNMTMVQAAGHLEDHARGSRDKADEGRADERPGMDASGGDAIGDGIPADRRQPPADSAVKPRRNKGRGARVSRVVMSLHGIRTRGTWQKELVPELSKAGFVPVPLDYGWFGAVKLLLPWSRRKQVDWFRDEYLKKCADHGCDRPSIIAHSFGTYLVARTIEIYMLEFDRVIFCGAIVRRDYPWSQLIDHGLVRRVLNDFGRLDLWARVVEWVVPDAGQSGLRSFEDSADGRVVQREHPEFGHGDYFYSKNFRERWVPFVRGEDPNERPVLPTPRRNWRARITAATFVFVFSINIIIFSHYLDFFNSNTGEGNDGIPDLRAPSTPDAYPKVDADHPQSPIDTEICTLTIFNETGEPLRLWRFIPELKAGVQPPPLGRHEMPGTWTKILLRGRDRPPELVNAGWSYITVERIAETGRDSQDRNPAAPDSAHTDASIETYDKGWVYFKFNSKLIVHISKTFFNDDPEDKRLGFSITNTAELEQPSS